MRAGRTAAERAGGIVFALVAGSALAWLAWNSATDPGQGQARAREERAVAAAERHLVSTVALGVPLEIVDPLNPNRAVGKTYVYPDAGGWEVSGYYRRGRDGRWHPWLMRLDGRLAMTGLALRETSPALLDIARVDPRIDILDD